MAIFREIKIGVGVLALPLFFSMCGGTNSDFESAEEALRERNIAQAVESYQRVISESAEDTGWVKTQLNRLFKSKSAEHEVCLAHERLGEIFSYHLLDYTKGIEEFKKALACYPMFKEGLSLREKMAEIYYLNLKDYQQAIVEYRRLLSNIPTNGNNAVLFFYRVIDSYRHIGNYDQVRNEGKDFLERYPQNGLVPNVLLEIAESYDLEGNNEQAIKEYKKVMEKLEKNESALGIYAEAAFLLGSIYSRLDRLDEAQEAYQKALKNHPHPELIHPKIEEIKQRRALEVTPKERREQYLKNINLRANNGT